MIKIHNLYELGNCKYKINDYTLNQDNSVFNYLKSHIISIKSQLWLLRVVDLDNCFLFCLHGSFSLRSFSIDLH